MIEQHEKETESQRARSKEEKYPEGGGTICTKDPRYTHGGELFMICIKGNNIKD